MVGHLQCVDPESSTLGVSERLKRGPEPGVVAVSGKDQADAVVLEEEPDAGRIRLRGVWHEFLVREVVHVDSAELLVSRWRFRRFPARYEPFLAAFLLPHRDQRGQLVTIGRQEGQRGTADRDDLAVASAARPENALFHGRFCSSSAVVSFSPSRAPKTSISTSRSWS